MLAIPSRARASCSSVCAIEVSFGVGVEFIGVSLRPMSSPDWVMHSAGRPPANDLHGIGR
jgi:hypothetical protein